MGGVWAEGYDLNRIIRSDLKSIISKSSDDFNAFYSDMYLPYINQRFGNTMIAKKKRRLKKDFDSGFLMLMKDRQKFIAGAIVRVNNDTVTEATIGVIDGSAKYLKSGVSGEMDYHLHEWAASKGKKYINIGHTRPFPSDGVYFNKRKWMMSVRPDQDGVMNIAVKLCLNGQGAAAVWEPYPFIYQTKTGLVLLCTYSGQEPLSMKQVKKFWKRFWTDGLNRIEIFAPGGFDPQARAYLNECFGSHVKLLKDLQEAMQLN
jgi:hypothetical protein